MPDQQPEAHERPKPASKSQVTDTRQQQRASDPGKTIACSPRHSPPPWQLTGTTLLGGHLHTHPARPQTMPVPPTKGSSPGSYYRSVAELGRDPGTLQLPHPTNPSLQAPEDAVNGRHRNGAPQVSPEHSLLSPLTLTCIRLHVNIAKPKHQWVRTAKSP